MTSEHQGQILAAAYPWLLANYSLNPEKIQEKIKIALTMGSLSATMHSAQQSRYGSPVLTPGQSQRVNMETLRRSSGVVLL